MKCNQPRPGFELASNPLPSINITQGTPLSHSLSLSLYIYIYSGIIVRVLANGQEDLGSNPGILIEKTHELVLDAIFLKTQHYKLRIKGKLNNP